MNERAQAIRLLVMDIDGVMTDGTIVVGAKGEEYRAFNVQDGLGIVLWQRAGGIAGIITSKRSAAVRYRARALHIKAVYQGVTDKKAALERLLAAQGLAWQQVCFMGDDLVDMPVLRCVGFAVTVPEAPAEVRALAHWVTNRPGGKGAVRDTVEYILRAQKRWDALVKEFEG